MKEIKVKFYPSEAEVVAIACEVAKSIGAKTKGLMYKSFLPKDKGMLFPFWFPWIRGFWMKNVDIPLDIIFINRNLKILNICEADVDSGWLHKIYWSQGLCKYVVECNKGFCKKHKILTGGKIEFENIKK